MRGNARALGLAALTFVLAACGGGGGSSSGGGGPSPPVATAPSFTSSTATSVTENRASTFYTATATDPQNDTIAISIAGGADGDKFVLESGGALRFNAAPNFDLPADADADNVYEVILRALAGGEAATLALRVTVTNDREGIVVRRVVTGIGEAVAMDAYSSPSQMLVADRAGRVLVVDTQTGTVREETFVRDNRISGEILAIARGFPGQTYQDGIYIVTHSPTQGLWLQGFNPALQRMIRVRMGDPWSAPVTASLVAQRELYIAIGDREGNRAQNSSSPYGKLYRIAEYCLYCSASLPLAGTLAGVPVLYGDGIQMPGGFSREADYLHLADRGSTRLHELTRFRRDWQPLDFGWPFYEGNVTLGTNPPAPVNGPTIVYSLGQGRVEGSGIVAGLLNDANFFEELGERYVFGDTRGAIFAFNRNLFFDGRLHGAGEIENRTLDFAPDVGTLNAVAAIVQGSGSDHFFILDADGEIFRVSGES